jgi:type IX secretion system PorP/SprF family membrane protein
MKSMKQFLLSISFSLIGFVAFAQSASPFRQFLFNPYAYNPAYTGIEGTTKLTLAYRKQWTNVQDAPTTQGLSFEYSTKKRVSLGLNILSDEVVALRNTTTIATFAYTVPLATDQEIRFGLSGGLGTNRLHLKEGEFDPTDETLIYAAQNNTYAHGNFGLVYVYKDRLKIGFTLPQIFKNNRFTRDNFDPIKFSTLGNQFYSISYLAPLTRNGISIEPYALYNVRSDGQNAWEAASIFHLKEYLQLGASYHQYNGLGLLAGISIKNFRIGYSYELPPVDRNFINTNSHEIQLSLKLGKKRDAIAKKSTTTKQSTYANEENAEEDVVDEEDFNNQEEAIVENSITPSTITDSKKTNQHLNDKPVEQLGNTQELRIADQKQLQNNTQKAEEAIDNVDDIAVKAMRPPMSFTLGKGHYVVVGAFKIMDNALKYAMTLQGKGISNPVVAINSRTNLYYVYVFSSYDIEEARRERNQMRLKRPLSEAWILTID